ncbi:MAG: ABC transporter related protein [candidate division Zixibacteria bacterium RBG-1]|nr:MAG: ABC transporter related protein [candidate division Zixibacteria bacterium RBG-1]OGC83266.1 MAG: glycerol-3-phosphate ABC transporter ATP-binding protein [candidate division Zixibacteria bacterium RBG_19FT_COMBO_42_43]
MANLSLKSVSKLFDTQEAVKDLTLDVPDGQFIVLVGPSGCGKSTTLRMIAGLESITSGEIWIGDNLVNAILPKDRDVAMVFQNYALYPHMTVFENIAFPLKIRKLPNSEIQARVKEVAQLLELESYLNKKPKVLSGGQRQRVALGRAIVRKPQVFLFDEPLSNLDAQLRTQLRGELIKLHQKLKTTSVYVTHDQAEAMTLGEKIVVLKDGLTQQIGTPAEIYNFPSNIFVAGFIGTPKMNLIKGNISPSSEGLFFHNDFKLALPQEKMSSLKNYPQIIIGLRPQAISLSTTNSNRNWMVKGNLELIENLGGEKYFYLNLKGEKLVAQVKEDKNYPLDSSLEIFLDLKQAYYFDPATGKCII